MRNLWQMKVKEMKELAGKQTSDQHIIENRKNEINLQGFFTCKM